MNTHQNLSGLQRPQHGGALILMVLILILGVAAVMMSSISVINSRPAVVLDPVTKQGLVAAKEGLITWAAMRGIANNTQVTPGLLPYPDRNNDGLYDGTSDCPPGAATYTTNYGKLPLLGEPSILGTCRGLNGLTLPDSNRPILDARDSTGETIWFAASPNLLDNRAPGVTQPLRTLSSALVTNAVGSAGNWLTVCDQQGRILSNEVAFVVIAPGGKLAGQVRPPLPSAMTPAPAPSNFLEAFPLPTTGTAPCNNPAESNFDNNDVYIANSGESVQFNDQLMYVTRREFFTRVTAAVARDIATRLNNFSQTSPGNVFPDAAAATAFPGNTGSCDNGVGPGRLPIACPWFTVPYVVLPVSTTTGWFGAITYSVDATRHIATIQFDSCPNIRYTNTRDILGNFTFVSTPSAFGVHKSC